jgi:uroporphyrinogen-III synthase
MRVLVTRPREQAERTAERLGALGHEPFVAPLLTIVPTQEPPPPAPFDAFIVTSAHAIPALASLRDAARQAPVFAVGERTAALARQAGLRQAQTAEGDGSSLAGLVARQLAPGARLLHVAGRERKGEPAAALVRAGFSVETWIAYEAVAATALPNHLTEALRTRRLDAGLHYSRRSAEILLGLADEAGLGPGLRRLSHFCLSADVAAPLQERGIERLIVAQRPDEASLFDALAVCEAPKPV